MQEDSAGRNFESVKRLGHHRRLRIGRQDQDQVDRGRQGYAAVRQLGFEAGVMLVGLKAIPVLQVGFDKEAATILYQVFVTAKVGKEIEERRYDQVQAKDDQAKFFHCGFSDIKLVNAGFKVI